MKTTLAVATLAALASVAFAKKLTLRSATQASCDKLKCPAAWRPKPNHHTLSGSTAADCCDKTCELFTCKGVYRSNEAYWGNVGNSPQVCCDKMCGADFECDVGYVLADASAAGVSKEDCCQPKCQLFKCTAPWAPSDAKKDVVSSSAEDCCEKTCAAVNCSMDGWAPNKSKDLEIGSTPEDCCTPLCGNSAQVKCPFGSAVKAENVNKTSDGTIESCCAPQCKSYKCSEGFAPDVAKDDAFGASDEECCLPTCKQFKCSMEDGWAPFPAVENDIGANASECCLATCKQWTCNATLGFLPYPDGAKDNVTGASNSICCLPACEKYTCAAKDLMKIPDATKVGGTTDEQCCESSKCDKVRKNMTAMSDKEFCNGLEKDQCLTKYSKHESGNSSAIVMCSFDDTYNLCRYDTEQAIKGGCAGI